MNVSLLIIKISAQFLLSIRVQSDQLYGEGERKPSAHSRHVINVGGNQIQEVSCIGNRLIKKLL